MSAGLADAGESSGEVGVILHRDEPIEREHTQGSIFLFDRVLRGLRPRWREAD